MVEGEEEMEETGGMFRSSYWLKWFLPGIALIAADTATRIHNGFAGISRSAGAATRGCSHEAAASVTEWRT